MDKISQLELLCNQPLGLSPRYAQYLQHHLNSVVFSDAELKENLKPEAAMKIEAMHFGGNYIDGNIAVISVHGSLAHRSSYFDLGYEYLKGAILAALDNESVNGIILDQSSGGGEIAGLFDFCDFVREASAVKPIWAIVNEHSMSACYCISAACTKIIAPRSAHVGSMGVVTAHMDVSKAMEDAGYKITLIYKGNNKVVGNPYEPLSDSTIRDIEASLDAPYNMMIEQISGHLGITEQELKNTEASVYSSSDALQKGLIHEIMSADQAFEAFSEELSGESSKCFKTSCIVSTRKSRYRWWQW